jgi:hypothetical protein
MALSTISLFDSSGVARSFMVYLNADGNYSMVTAATTTVPTPLASGHTLAVTGSAALLSSITGGIPSGATHALLSVPPGGANIYFTEDGTVPTAGGLGICIPAGGTFELTNLSTVRLISDAGTVNVYPAFRRY